MTKTPSHNMRQAFEETMEGMFCRFDWKDVVPIRQQLEMEDAFMAGVQSCFLSIIATDGKSAMHIDGQLTEFGKRIITRYKEAGIDLTNAIQEAEEFAKAKAATAAAERGVSDTGETS